MPGYYFVHEMHGLQIYRLINLQAQVMDAQRYIRLRKEKEPDAPPFIDVFCQTPLILKTNVRGTISLVNGIRVFTPDSEHIEYN